jgi:hypothetical protein
VKLLVQCSSCTLTELAGLADANCNGCDCELRAATCSHDLMMTREVVSICRRWSRRGSLQPASVRLLYVRPVVVLLHRDCDSVSSRSHVSCSGFGDDVEDGRRVERSLAVPLPSMLAVRSCAWAGMIVRIVRWISVVSHDSLRA